MNGLIFTFIYIFLLRLVPYLLFLNLQAMNTFYKSQISVKPRTK